MVSVTTKALFEEMVREGARALRVGRGCQAGEVTCHFCYWGPDELTPEWDETGCMWLARACLLAALERLREPSEEMAVAGLFANTRDTSNTDPNGVTAISWPPDPVWQAMLSTLIEAAKEKTG